MHSTSRGTGSEDEGLAGLGLLIFGVLSPKLEGSGRKVYEKQTIREMKIEGGVEFRIDLPTFEMVSV